MTEGAGAVPVAALFEHPELFYQRHVALVISGGNIDRELLTRALSTPQVTSHWHRGTRGPALALRHTNRTVGGARNSATGELAGT